MTHKTNYFIKAGAHDHRKATKLVMSLQSSEIKFAGAILLSVLTLKKLPLTPMGSRVTQNISWEPLKKSAFCYLVLLQTLKGAFTQKIMRILEPQSL